MTKIQGQPFKNYVTILQKELGWIAQNVHTTIGGGNHGHLRLIMEDTDYQAISNGEMAFIIPNNSGSVS